jgi:hypothetical protein
MGFLVQQIPEAVAAVEQVLGRSMGMVELAGLESSSSNTM